MIITLIIVAAGGFVYIQKQKITAIFSEKKNVDNSKDKILMGSVIEIRDNSIVIQVPESNVPMEYEININTNSKIYQDQDVVNGAPIVADKSIIKIGSSVIVGLTGSKNEKILFVDSIHVLPEVK